MSAPPPPSSTTCPRCHGPRDWHGACPRCLLEGALTPESATTASAPTPPLSTSPAPAGRLGRYELVAELGRGGMGVVWRVRHPTLERDVALKRLHVGVEASPMARERFRREARAAARLRHPGIVAVHDIDEIDGEWFLVLELVEGPTLAQRLQSGPLPPTEAAELVRALADAVQSAHDGGVIHRDIKPGNILLDRLRNGAPRLTDFGIARLADDAEASLTGTLQGLGTLAYLAPEQAAGRSDLQGPRTDVHGLGAVLYHVLTGQPPFPGNSPATVLRAVAEMEPRPPRQIAPSIPRGLEVLCLRCLEKEPNRRFASAAELRDELDRFLRQEPILTRPASALELGWRWVRRRPARSSWGLAAMILAVAFAWPFFRPTSRPAARLPPPSLAELVDHWPVRQPGDPVQIPLAARVCTAIAYSPNGRWLALGNDSCLLRVLPGTPGRSPRPVLDDFLPAPIRELAWSGDSRRLLAVDAGGSWRLWGFGPNIEPLGSGSTGSRIDAAALNSDGTVFFTSHQDGIGRLWGRNDGEARLLHQFEIPDGVWGAYFTPDGRRLVTVCPRGLVNLRDGITGELVCQLADWTLGAAAVRPTGAHVAVVRTNDGPRIALSLLRTEDGREDLPPVIVDQPVTGFDFSPDGGRIAVATGAQLRLVPLDADRPAPTIITPPYPAQLVRFAPDGLTLLTCSASGVMEVRDGHSGVLLAGPITNSHLFWRHQFSPVAPTLAGAGPGGVLLLWDVALELPAGRGSRTETADALLRLGTLPALRRAAQLDPADSRRLAALAALTRATGTPADRLEADFLERLHRNRTAPR